MLLDLDFFIMGLNGQKAKDAAGQDIHAAKYLAEQLYVHDDIKNSIKYTSMARKLYDTGKAETDLTDLELIEKFLELKDKQGNSKFVAAIAGPIQEAINKSRAN